MMTSQSSAIDVNSTNSEPSAPLWEILEKSALRWGETTALISCHQPAKQLDWILGPGHRGRTDSTHLELTYSKLLLAAKRLGADLSQAGLKRGDVVMVLLPNCAEQIILFWACAWLGVITALVNPQLMDRPESGELGHLFAQLKPACIATRDENWARKLEKGLPELVNSVNLKFRCLISQFERGSPGSQWITAQDLSQMVPSDGCRQLEPFDYNLSRTESIAVLLSTSGTTSLPKTCAHTEGNLDFESRQYYANNGLGPESKELGHGPNFHIAAVVRNLMIWRAGAALVLPSSVFDAEAIFDALKNLRCTHMSGVPSLLIGLFSRSDFMANQ
jgi:acyl-CoA synthetase (AMP-forming)/AMP-acid ligase II